MNKEQLIQSFLGDKPFILVNEDLLKYLKGDCVSTILLGKLIGIQRYFKKSNQLKDDWFFQKVDTILQSLGISYYNQKKAFHVLEKIGFISCSVRGVPPKRFFKINFDNIYEKFIQGNDIFVPFVPKEPPTKQEFYDKLNKAIYTSLEETKVALDNIPYDIGEFLVAWSLLYQNFYKCLWKWDSRQFGILRNYWREVYQGKRAYNYNTLWQFLFSEKKEGVSIISFIHFDRSNYEYHKEHKTSCEEVLQKRGVK